MEYETVINGIEHHMEHLPFALGPVVGKDKVTGEAEYPSKYSTEVPFDVIYVNKKDRIVYFHIGNDRFAVVIYVTESNHLNG